MSFLFLIAVPILTMRTFAEERKQKTDQLLYALPLGMTKIVLGKFFALVTVLLVPCVIIGFYPLILSRYGDVPMASCYGTLLAFFLLGCTLLALGMLLSSLTESQAVSAAVCFVALLILYFIGSLSYYVPGTANASLAALLVLAVLVAAAFYGLTGSSIAGYALFGAAAVVLVLLRLLSSATLEGLFPAMMNRLSVFDVFTNFAAGVFDISSIIYYVSIIVVLLFLTVQSMEKRRWL
jgi:ABC-2 type transport system permease protein